jgi:hypothetical protein
LYSINVNDIVFELKTLALVQELFSAKKTNRTLCFGKEKMTNINQIRHMFSSLHAISSF